MEKRTVREFNYQGQLWPLVEKWAVETGFILAEEEKNRRLYQKGQGWLMAPAMLEIRQSAGKIVLSAWIKADYYLVLSLLRGEKPESGIESGGLTAAIPRRRAREAVNQLLAKLGQAPVT
jgi:hypothetical protein